MSVRKRILFLCTGNSCRSQMAEGLARHAWADRYEVHSAGVERHGLNPLAVRVMKEIGIDIADHRSKLLDEFGSGEFDYVVTVCDRARESCPVFAGSARVIHHSFDDPPKLAADSASEEEALVYYRRVRDEIECFIRDLLPELDSAKSDRQLQ